MNADKFTQKTIETIQTAQSMAQENGNQYLTPEHLLYALVDADGGLIGTLLGRMGVDCLLPQRHRHPHPPGRQYFGRAGVHRSAGR